MVCLSRGIAVSDAATQVTTTASETTSAKSPTLHSVQFRFDLEVSPSRCDRGFLFLVERRNGDKRTGQGRVW